MQQYCSKYRVKGAVVKPSVNVAEQFLFRKNIVFRNGSNPAIKTPEQLQPRTAEEGMQEPQLH